VGVIITMFIASSLLQNKVGFKPYFNDVSDAKILHSIDSDSAIVFFAFAGCSDICPPTLQEISSYAETVNKSTGNNRSMSIVVVNLIPKMGSDVFKAYVKGYSKSLIPLTPTNDQLDLLKNLFSVQAGTAIGSGTQINHTGMIYLIVKESSENWKISRVLPNGEIDNL